MLKEIVFENFRCFKKYKINFNQFNVIVGKNNAGKSTIIDGIKIISNVIRYAPHRKFFSTTDPTDIDSIVEACFIERRDIPFSLVNIQHNYSKATAVITSTFENKKEVKIVFPYDDNPYAIFLINGRNIHSTKTIKQEFPSSIGIIPSVGLFEDIEQLGDRKYLQSIIISHLMPRHFRNIWYYFNDDFEEFKHLLESTWASYTIELPELDMNANRLDMFFKEDNITREIFWSGHGLQIWLQLLTFLVKLGKKESLVLDEPDVYLHSDLQKKLIHLCKERSNQVIIATHAVDIIEECNPDEIISVDNKLNKSTRLSSIDEVQTCITQLGSYQNLKLVHFLKGKTCLFIEGQDFKYIKKFSKILNEKKIVNEDGFSIIPLEGFSNWDRLKDINWIFITSLGETIKCYLILDRDYRPENLISEIREFLSSKNVNVHIWKKKEIENYAIKIEVLYRVFIQKYKERNSKSVIPLSYEEFREKVLKIAEEFRTTVFSQQTADEIKSRPDRSEDISKVIAKRHLDFENQWKDVEYRLTVIPGKDFFARFNKWLGEEYHLSISINTVLFSMKLGEIDPEVSDVIREFVSLIES